MMNGVSPRDLLQVALFFVILLVTALPLGRFIARVMAGERTFLTPVLGPGGAGRLPPVRGRPGGRAALDGLHRRDAAVQPGRAAADYLVFSSSTCCPEPQGFGPVSADLAFNTAVSFTTNTNWQNYVPARRRVSYFTQMVGLAVAQLHLGRDRHRDRRRAGARARPAHRERRSATSGPTWSARTLYLLLPICLVVALVLVWQGVPQNLGGLRRRDHGRGRASRRSRRARSPARRRSRSWAPTAAASSTPTPPTPSRTRTPLTNFDRDRSPSSLIPVGADLHLRPHGRRHAARAGRSGPRWPSSSCSAWRWRCRPSRRATRCSPQLGVDQAPPLQAAATWRARRSASASPARCSSPSSRPPPPAARSTPCTTASCRWPAWCRWSTCSSARSSSAGSAPGLYGMLVFAILAVFIAGLMVGRTPEYLGKKIEAFEMKMAMLAVLVLAAARSWASPRLGRRAAAGTARPGNPGAARLHARSSTPSPPATGNNGSAFAGLSANTRTTTRRSAWRC